MKPKFAPETFAGVSKEARKILEELDAAATYAMLSGKCRPCRLGAHCKGRDLDCLCVCTEREP